MTNADRAGKGGRLKLLLLIALVAALGLAAFLIISNNQKNSKYDAAMRLQGEGFYQDAAVRFADLGGHKDSPQQMDYSLMLEALKAEQWADVAKRAEKLNSLRDSQAILHFAQAQTAMEQARYPDALKGLEQAEAAKPEALLQPMIQAAQQQAGYRLAKEELAAGQYDEAIARFQGLDGYEDSASMVDYAKNRKTAAIYQAGSAAFYRGDYDEAIAAFEQTTGFDDSDRLLEQSRYRKRVALHNDGMQALKQEDYEAAKTAFAQLEDNAEVAALLKHLNSGPEGAAYARLITHPSDDLRSDAAAFDEISSYENAKAMAATLRERADEQDYQQARLLLAEGAYEDAGKLLQTIPHHKDALILLAQSELGPKDEAYAAALRLMAEHQTEEAVKAFEALGNHRDSRLQAQMGRQRLKAEAYGRAQTLEMLGSPEAIDIYESLGDYLDSPLRAQLLRVAPPSAGWPREVTGSGKGYRGPVTVTLKVNKDRTIAAVTVNSEQFSETEGFGSLVLEQAFTDRFIGKTLPIKAGDIDVIAGATVSSKAVIDAVNRAAETLVD